MKRVHRDLAALLKSLHSQFDGQVKLRESSFEFDGDDVLVIRFTIVFAQMMVRPKSVISASKDLNKETSSHEIYGTFCNSHRPQNSEYLYFYWLSTSTVRGDYDQCLV